MYREDIMIGQEASKKFLWKDTFFYFLLLLLLLFRFFPFGFSYYPYMDDFNQLGIYHLKGAPYITNSFLHYNLYMTRPMAGFLDVFFWSFFWNHLEIAALIILLFFWGTLILLDKLFKEANIAFGRMGLVFVASFFLLTESTYWLSASTRLVVGGFFTVLTVYLFLKAMKEKYKKHRNTYALAAFFIGFIAQGFYEQLIAFYLILFFGLVWVERKKIKHFSLAILPVVHVLFIGIYYFIFRNTSNIADRGQTDIPIFAQIKNTFQGIFQLLFIEGKHTASYTFFTGIRRIFKDYTWLAIALLLLSILLSFLIIYEPQRKGIYKKYKAIEETTHVPMSILAFLGIWFGSFAPFFLISYGLLFFRNLYPAVIGLGILASIILFYCKKNEILKIIFLPVTIFLIFFGSTANIFHVESMKILNENDTAIVNALLAESKDIKDGAVVWVVDAKYAYDELAAPHFVSSTAANWSLTGRATVQNKAYLNQPRKGYMTFEPFLYAEPRAFKLEPEDKILCILPDKTVIPLYEKNGFLYTNEHEVYGKLVIENELYRFEIQ